MKIDKLGFEETGLKRVYENESWTVGVKNWKPENDLIGFTNIERHNESDELFILLDGNCTLIFANEVDGKLEFDYVKMEKNHVYNIPKTLWHNTITSKDVKLTLIEYSNTGMENSDVLELTKEQIEEITNKIGHL